MRERGLQKCTCILSIVLVGIHTYISQEIYEANVALKLLAMKGKHKNIKHVNVEEAVLLQSMTATLKFW